MSKINEISVDNIVYEIEDKNAVHTEADPVFSTSPAGGIKSTDIENWNNKSDFSGDYDDLTNKPDLSQFITNTVNNLTNYYLKSETYTQAEVNNLIGTIQQFHYEIVQELPQTGANNILYLVPKSESQTQNVYDEYVYANNTWEKIGDTEIDLSGYVTTTDLSTALANYTTTTDLTTLLAGKQNTIDSTHKLSSDLVDDTNATNKFVTSGEKTTWNGKQDVIQYNVLPTAGAGNLGKIIQYTGATDSTYTQGHFYIVVTDGEAEPTYSWQEISLGSGSGGESIPTIKVTGLNTTAFTTDEMKARFKEVIENYYNNDKYDITYIQATTSNQYIYPVLIESQQKNVSSFVLIPFISFVAGHTDNGNYASIHALSFTIRCAITQSDGVYTASNLVFINIYSNDMIVASSSNCLVRYNGSSTPYLNALATNNTTEYTPSGNYNPATKKYVDDYLTAITGYDATKTQTLKNINGVLSWQDD